MNNNQHNLNNSIVSEFIQKLVLKKETIDAIEY